MDAAGEGLLTLTAMAAPVVAPEAAGLADAAELAAGLADTEAGAAAFAGAEAAGLAVDAAGEVVTGELAGAAPAPHAASSSMAATAWSTGEMDFMACSFGVLNGDRQRVQVRAIVPEDLALVLVADRQREEGVGRMGEFGVDVRIVGRVDDVVAAAQEVDGVADGVLFRVDGHIALPAEVVARPHGQLRRPDVAEHLGMLVEPPQQPRQPAGVAFQEGDPEPRMPLQHAARADGAQGQHLLERVRVHVVEAEVRDEVVA